MSNLAVGDLYEKNGQTEFPCYSMEGGNGTLFFGNASAYKAVIRYRWNGAAWVSEIVEEKQKIYGSGK